MMSIGSTVVSSENLCVAPIIFVFCFTSFSVDLSLEGNKEYHISLSLLRECSVKQKSLLSVIIGPATMCYDINCINYLRYLHMYIIYS